MSQHPSQILLFDTIHPIPPLPRIIHTHGPNAHTEQRRHEMLPPFLMRLLSRHAAAVHLLPSGVMRLRGLVDVVRRADGGDAGQARVEQFLVAFFTLGFAVGGGRRG